MMPTEQKNPLTNAKIVGTNIDVEVYLRQEAQRGDKDYAMTRSDLMEFARCPHRWRMGYKDDDTKATDWGSLIDCMVLDTERFNQRFAVAPATYSVQMYQCPVCQQIRDSKACRNCKTARVEVTVEKEWNWMADYCDQWRQQHDGQHPIKAEQHSEALRAVDLLFSDREIAEEIHRAEHQVMAVAEYEDTETGLVVPVKVLTDIVPAAGGRWGRSLIDFKTGSNAAPGQWKRVTFERGYHVQGAMNLDCYVVATGEDRVEFRHIIQESFEPWEIGKRLLSAEFVELGRLNYVWALKRYCQCLATNEWPGYDHEGGNIIAGFTLVEPEAWMVGR